MMIRLEDDVFASVPGGVDGLTAGKLAASAIRYADARLGGRFRLGGGGYPADGSKPINMWTEKGLDGYQVYLHDRRLGATSVITDTSGRPVRIKPL
jgi:hypothetical protein